MSDPGSTPCAICGTTFDAKLESPSGADDWTFHWGGLAGTTVVGETCSDVCTAAFEARRPDA